MCSIMGYTAKDLRLEDLTRGFARTKSRGPDASRTLETPAGWLFFHRLAIMGLTESGMQPFTLGGSSVVCNGELYGFRAMRAALAEKGYAFESDSDCEILLPLYREYGVDMFAMLDAEFAMILYDAETGGFLAARDPIGIRPLYYGYSERAEKPCRALRENHAVPARALLQGRRVRLLLRHRRGRCRLPGRYGDRLPEHPGKAGARH